MSDFKAKRTKFNFGWGLRPRPCWGSLQRSPKPGLKRPVSKGRGGEAGKEEVEGGDWSPQLFFCGSTPMFYCDE